MEAATHPIQDATTRYLPAQTMDLPELSSETQIYRVLQARKQDLPAATQEALRSPLVRSPLEAHHHAAVQRLTDDIYYQANTGVTGPAFAALGRQRLAQMLEKGTSGYIYTKSQTMVAALLLKTRYQHPALEAATTHVAFWGYSRKLLSIEEARSIKHDWLRILASCDAPRISMQVGVFNEVSKRFANQLGFPIQAWRVDTLVAKNAVPAVPRAAA